jgi:hypothetical protein
MVINQMIGSQVQQGAIGSQQHGTFNEPNRDQLRAVAELLRTMLPDLGLDDDDHQEAEAELSTAEISSAPTGPNGTPLRPASGGLSLCLSGPAPLRPDPWN